MTMNMYANGYKGYIINDILLDYRMTSEGYKKKKFKHRITECRVRFIYFKKMKIKLYQYIFVIKPILAGIIPKRIMKLYQNSKLTKN